MNRHWLISSNMKGTKVSRKSQLLKTLNNKTTMINTTITINNLKDKVPSTRKERIPMELLNHTTIMIKTMIKTIKTIKTIINSNGMEDSKITTIKLIIKSNLLSPKTQAMEQMLINSMITQAITSNKMLKMTTVLQLRINLQTILSLGLFPLMIQLVEGRIIQKLSISEKNLTSVPIIMPEVGDLIFHREKNKSLTSLENVNF